MKPKPALGQWAKPLQIKKEDPLIVKTQQPTTSVCNAPIPKVCNSRKQRWLRDHKVLVDRLYQEMVDSLDYIDRQKFIHWLLEYTTI